MTIYVFENGIRARVPFVTSNGTKVFDLSSETVRESLGITVVPTPVPPEEYNAETWDLVELDEEPYVQYVPKANEQVALIQRQKLIKKIDDIEREYMLPRVVRESLLYLAEKEAREFAAANGNIPLELVLDRNEGYKRTKQIDNQIVALRNQLKTLE